jgi:hypothetical protein
VRVRALTFFLALLAVAPAAAQDSVVARHLLQLDVSRLQSTSRRYDIVVRRRDSLIVVGERRVDVRPALYAGADAWLIVETRTGEVPAAESLYVSPDFRPLHWASALGPARLATEFVGDSILGAASAGRSKQNIALQGRPDVLVNHAMVEVMLSLLPLADAWVDSAASISVNLSGTALTPSELAVVASENMPVDSSVVPVWVVALRSAESSVLYWVEKSTGVPFLIQQQVPAHVGGQMEFRLKRPQTAAGSP